MTHEKFWNDIEDILYAWENLIRDKERISAEEANSLFEQLHELWLDRDRQLFPSRHP